MSSALHLFLLAGLVLAGGALPAGGPSAAPSDTQPVVPGVTVAELTYAGDGNVSIPGDDLVLWQSAAHRFAAVIEANGSVDGEACLIAVPGGGESERELSCTAVTIPANATETVNLSVEGWPTDLNGSQEATIRVRTQNGPASSASRETGCA